MARESGQRQGYCVETVDLTHKFTDGETVLSSVNLRVFEGSIYGFLGPNGAGKTTTLKLILGLLKKQQGEIRVFGKPFETNRVETLRRTGAMIESPSIYGHLTAVENLKILQKVYGSPQTRIEEVLKQVGLEASGQKKAAQFSLGMKQRLAIAIALLHSPQLLILDEPTNGLDPNGILEIRELLKDLNAHHGITILVSSHLLPEIEKLATHIGIINRGVLRFQGAISDLLSRRRENSSIVFGTNDAAKTRRIIGEFGSIPQERAGKIAIPELENKQIAALNEKLVRGGVEVYRIDKIEDDLEEIFFDVIKDRKPPCFHPLKTTAESSFEHF